MRYFGLKHSEQYSAFDSGMLVTQLWSADEVEHPHLPQSCLARVFMSMTHNHMRPALRSAAISLATMSSADLPFSASSSRIRSRGLASHSPST